jgi:DNA adenine methylase
MVAPSSNFIQAAARFFKVPTETLRVAAGKLPRDIEDILSNYPDEATSVLRDMFAGHDTNGYGHRSGGTMCYVDSQAMNSPFRYAGGKFYARKLILAHLPAHTVYIEPFVGGGSIFFAKPKAKINWLNDIDADVMNCYIQIRDNPKSLIRFLRGRKASKETHAYFKNEFKWSTDLERAGRWYYLNRTSYSGIMNMQNCFWGYADKYSMRPENWPTNIYRTSAKLQGVKLSCGDFEKVIAEAPDGAFLFIDPPYFNADQDKFYTHAFEVEDHQRLARILHTRRKEIRFLLTYDDEPQVRELYSWADRRLEKAWNYTINRTDDQTGRTTRRGTRYKGHELFIMNYPDEYLDLFGEFEWSGAEKSIAA